MRPVTEREIRKAGLKAARDSHQGREQRLRRMRGRAHELTKEAWAQELGVSPQTAYKYAQELGESCAPTEVERGTLTDRNFDTSVMARMARMPIGGRG